jgi:hypothetical protein
LDPITNATLSMRGRHKLIHYMGSVDGGRTAGRPYTIWSMTEFRISLNADLRDELLAELMSGLPVQARR